MRRRWPQGRPPGGDICPDGAGGDHEPKIMKKKEIFFFQVVKIFLELFTGRVGVRLKGWEELLGAWGLGKYPQMAKNAQKRAKSHFCHAQAPPMGDSAA